MTTLAEHQTADTVFQNRLARHYDELKWLYCELYEGGSAHFETFCGALKQQFLKRPAALKKLDETRLDNPDWYRNNDMTGMMMYTDAFAKTLNGVREKLDYITDCGVNCLHLMPLLDTPDTENDGGYAVSDFTRVRKDLGTMDDLAALAEQCHARNICLCLDFVMNHTSQEHEWARRARAGEKEYQDRYFFYDSYDIPARFEQTCPQVFPTTAPGNFTWLEDIRKFVMTTFYPYQWDLNYRNPVVFHAMVDNLLHLTNKGIDIIRIDAVPYIWKELDTNCRNLPQVHNIVRMLRMICEIVCPGVLLLGEVVMEPVKVVPYFGTLEKPECHMLYNVTTMATTWHTVATRNTSLLKRQMDLVSSLPKEYVFLNYLRCHDDIGWGLEYDWLKRQSVDEVAHKQFLSRFFTGSFYSSESRGELYNDDPTSGDARLCGTTASLCGIETALAEQDENKLSQSIACDLMLHGYMLTQSGIPMIYSGDEIGQCNDYHYKEDSKKAADSRYVHRGPFHWEAAKQRKDTDTVPGKLFTGIRHMMEIRKTHNVFLNTASVSTRETHDNAVLCLVRTYRNEKLVALFNFSPWEKTAWINEDAAPYQDLISGQTLAAQNVSLPPYAIRWLYRTETSQ